MAARVIIIGAGVSGLSTAYFLGKLGIASLLLEKSERLGGLIKTDVVDGCQLEAGPDSYIASKPAVTELAQELGDLGREIIPSNDKARRVFIRKHGRMIPMPPGMVFMVPSELKPAFESPLFSVQSKLRFLTERFARPRRRNKDISVGQLVREHFGEEMLDYVAEPLLAGVYGGDATALSAASVLPRFVAYEEKYGSLIAGAREERRAQGSHAGAMFQSFQGGMQSLTDALAAATRAHTEICHGEAIHVSQSEDAWQVETTIGSFASREVVLACPAHVASRLLRGAVPVVAGELAGIPYSSAILVTLVFERASISHSLNGFGFLVPRRERNTIAAATWINTKFPSRIADGRAAIRAFIVGEQATRLLPRENVELLSLVRRDLSQLMGVEAEPRFATAYKWPDSMPQYVVGHSERHQRLRAALEQHPGIHLVGNAYSGVGVPDCVRMAKDTSLVIRSRIAA
ncbi:MAG: protoporphyrinogen oxidase [Acidobacteriaceae bacterium]|nr:protoporphyrinogen oxidase [Acidobacteriaceae bacterium]